MNQFTPAPWTRLYVPVDQEIRIKAGTEVLMTVHHYGRDRELEQEANADLVTASPLLFVALRQSRALCRAALRSGKPKDWQRALEQIGREAEALIVKITGPEQGDHRDQKHTGLRQTTRTLAPRSRR